MSYTNAVWNWIRESCSLNRTRVACSCSIMGSSPMKASVLQTNTNYVRSTVLYGQSLISIRILWDSILNRREFQFFIAYEVDAFLLLPFFFRNRLLCESTVFYFRF